MKTVQSKPLPTWLQNALIPFAARLVARGAIKRYPELSAEAILDKMREQSGDLDANGKKLMRSIVRYLPKHHVPTNIAARLSLVLQTDAARAASISLRFSSTSV